MSDRLDKAISLVPSSVEKLLLDRFTVEGVLPFNQHDAEQMFDSRLSGFENRLFTRLSVLQTAPPASVDPLTISASAATSDTGWPLHCWPDGSMHLVKKDFRFQRYHFQYHIQTIICEYPHVHYF